jgi:hypothetical protein
MSKPLMLAGVAAFLFAGALCGDEPKSPFAQAPAGVVSIQQSAKGSLVISNVPGNRYTYALPGSKVAKANYENKENPHARIWDVDGIVIQSVPVTLPNDAKLDYAQVVLLDHQKYESDYAAKGGFKEVESARQWLNSPSGVALYWELQNANPAATGAKKLLFANTTNGRNVILFSTSLLPNVDESKAKKLLTETVQSLRRYEKNVVAPLNPGEATTFLVNDEIGTKEDRAAAGALVVKPETSVMLVRMAFELSPRHQMLMTAVHDGKSGHMINLLAFDPKTKRFHFSDTLGKKSFLSEDNNRAGVKAERLEGPDRIFTVTVPELQSVLEAVISVPFFAQRSYFTTQTMEGAIAEYKALSRVDPKSPELTEAHLLRAGQIMAEFKEDARAVNVYAVCRGLHPGSSRALAGIAEIFARIGRVEPSINFYADALKALPKDPSVDAPSASCWPPPGKKPARSKRVKRRSDQCNGFG